MNRPGSSSAPAHAGAAPRASTPPDGWDVYIARCADGSLYTGIARDAEARIEQHNAGRGARYTRGRSPVELVYRERAADRGGAQRREAAIKALATAEKRRLIATRPD